VCGSAEGVWGEGRRRWGADSRSRQRRYTKSLAMLPALGSSGKGSSLGHEGGSAG